MGSRYCGRAFAVAFITFLSFCIPMTLSAQASGRPEPGSRQIGQEGEPIPKDIAARMEKERQKSRYDSLKRDSERLLELATELKQYVDNSGEDVMSLDVIRKCDEIEKLSKSIRSKMKGN